MEAEASFDQMKGAIGSLLWIWVEIERASRKEVARANGGTLPKSAHGIAGVLDHWENAVVRRREEWPFRAALAMRLREQLQVALNIRNGICHGLDGWSAARGKKPATVTWTIGETKRSITWPELQTIFAWLSKVPYAIDMISSADSSPRGRTVDTSENREWWAAEYGIDLPRQ